MAVPHDAIAPVRQRRILHRGQKRVGYRLDGLGKQPAGATYRNSR
jgi:hypothetical protein